MNKRKKYKIHVSIDKQNQYLVVIKNGRLIRNPTEEDLIGANLKSYNSTNVCPECRKENNITDKSILFPGNVLRNTAEKGNKVNEWLCKRHGLNNYNRNSPNSNHSLVKLLSARRTGNVNYPNHIFGDKCQEVTVSWLGTEDLNKRLDNYKTPIDHSSIPDGVFIEIGEKLVNLSGKIPQTKGSNFRTNLGIDGGWEITHLEKEYNKEFDIMIVYCVGKHDTIERIYIFPKAVLINKRKSLSIVKNPTKGIQWYNQYMVTDVRELNNVNKIFLN